MLKRSENIDPGTQEWGTSIDLPGTTKRIANTPVGVTGPGHEKSQKKNRTPKDVIELAIVRAEKDRHENTSTPSGQRPPQMRKTDFGVRLAMDTNYVSGFMDKCASVGVDPEMLVKQSIDWGKLMGAAKPIMQRLNPLNLFSGGKGLIKSVGQMGRARSNLAQNMMPSLQGLSPANQYSAVRHALSNDPFAQSAMRGRMESLKNFGGGLASTAGLGTLGYEALKPEPKPPTMLERLSGLFKHIL